MSLTALIHEIQDAYQSASLFQERSIAERARLLETIRLYTQLRARDPAGTADADTDLLAAELATRIGEYHTRLFRRYRTVFQQERGSTELRQRLMGFTAYRGEPGFRHLVREDVDLLLDGVLGYDIDTMRLPKRSPEHTHLEAVPGSLIMELVDHYGANDTGRFVDLGCGLGHAMILYGLLTGRSSVGVELEPEYCAGCRTSIRALGLSDAVVVEGDLLDFPLHAGDLVFIFSPVSGRLLVRLAERLRAAPRPLRVCSGGPASRHFASSPGFRIQRADMNDPYRCAMFELN
jgi:hypothetical protein